MIQIINFVENDYIQNIPQLLVEIVVILHIGNNANDTIVYVSMIFSVLSAFTGIYEMCAPKSVLQWSRDHVMIEFDVIGIVNASKYRQRVKGIRDGISSLLGIDKDGLEVVRPSYIPKGLRVCINVGINYDSRSNGNNIADMINEAHETEELAEIIKHSWSLSKVPVIDNLAVF